MNGPQIIGAAVIRLSAEYQLALEQAGHDESIISFYLPGEWAPMAQRVFALIVSETKRLQGDQPKGKRRERCEACGNPTFGIVRDHWRGRSTVICAACGQVCHV